MPEDVSGAQKPPEDAEATSFKMRIGKTTYIVFVHFSKTSTETVEDKIMRLIQHEAQEKDAPRTD
jgi:hypothetical protein